MLTRQLTSESVRTLRNPIVSDLGNYITYSSRGYGEPSKATEYMYWLNLITEESDIIPSPDTVSVNPCYSETENYVIRISRIVRSRLVVAIEVYLTLKGGAVLPIQLFNIPRSTLYCS
jgi:hypothetical protein